ncbi:MAG: hypothetical protein OXG15_02290 [Gammaproteobacteria bacterium]|nr:hypothetical protein [Gammaproteobacteria bacterium]
MKKEKNKHRKIPEPSEMKIPARDYQPSRAELREETDMPRLSLKRARAMFMRPFRFINDPD